MEEEPKPWTDTEYKNIVSDTEEDVSDNETYEDDTMSEFSLSESDMSETEPIPFFTRRRKIVKKEYSVILNEEDFFPE